MIHLPSTDPQVARRLRVFHVEQVDTVTVGLTRVRFTRGMGWLRRRDMPHELLTVDEVVLSENAFQITSAISSTIVKS
jgi:hypothetical protein